MRWNESSLNGIRKRRMRVKREKERFPSVYVVHC